MIMVYVMYSNPNNSLLTLLLRGTSGISQMVLHSARYDKYNKTLTFVFVCSRVHKS